MKHRCDWATNELNTQYHDQEWGAPLHDDQKLFEFLILEGAQAGLSWDTVLKKRESYREAFDNFDPHIVADYSEEKITELLQNPGIIRNKLKINSAIRNARVFLEVQKEFGSFDAYLQTFTGSEPLVHNWRKTEDIPVETETSQALSKDLKKRGMNFVGPTIMYAFLQATGAVNDHLTSCFRHPSQKNAVY